METQTVLKCSYWIVTLQELNKLLKQLFCVMQYLGRHCDIYVCFKLYFLIDHHYKTQIYYPNLLIGGDEDICNLENETNLNIIHGYQFSLFTNVWMAYMVWKKIDTLSFHRWNICQVA